MKWINCGAGDSDIYQCADWELVRKAIGFGMERVTILKAGERVMQIEAQEGLKKAMEWVASQSRVMKTPAFEHENGDGI
jgi:hypothetical protein